MSPSARGQGIAALLIVVLAWGLTWPVNKVVLQQLSPLWAVVLRCALATVALFALVGVGMSLITGNHYWDVAGTAAIGR